LEARSQFGGSDPVGGQRPYTAIKQSALFPYRSLLPRSPQEGGVEGLLPPTTPNAKRDLPCRPARVILEAAFSHPAQLSFSLESGGER
jgi:hypothetical protein